MNEVTVGDKIYISTARAAEITGYARDYIGQLCREGSVEAKMIGRSWYVFEPSVRMHRFGNATIPTESKDIAEEEAQEAKSNEDDGVSGWKPPTYSSEEPQDLTEMLNSPLQEVFPSTEETLTDMQGVWREWFETQQRKNEEVKDELNEEEDEKELVEEAETVSIEESNELESEDEDSTEEVEIPIIKVEEEIIAENDSIAAHLQPELEEEGTESVQIHTIPSKTNAISHAPIQARVSPQREEAYGRIIEEQVVTRPSYVVGSTGNFKATSKRNKARRAKVAYATVAALLIGVSVLAITVAVIGTGVGNKYSASVINSSNPVIDFLVGTRKYDR